MGVFTATKTGKVKWEHDSKVYFFRSNMHVLPDLKNENVILIADDIQDQHGYKKGFRINIDDVTSPTFIDRNDLITQLAEFYFVSEERGVSLEEGQALNQFLVDSGDSPDMNILGSLASPVLFTYKVPIGRIAKISILNVIIVDGAVEFVSSDFGRIAGGLTNGIFINIYDSAHDIILEDIGGWKTNIDLAFTFFDIRNAFRDGAYTGNWELKQNFGRAVELMEEQEIELRIQDDLQTIDRLNFLLVGELLII